MTVGTNIRNLDGRVCIYLRGTHACTVYAAGTSLHRAGARVRAMFAMATASSWNAGITFRHNRERERERDKARSTSARSHAESREILACINVVAISVT